MRNRTLKQEGLLSTFGREDLVPKKNKDVGLKFGENGE